MPSIAKLLGCNAETVKRVRQLYRRGNLEALTPQKPSGRPARATPSFRALLVKAIQAPPQTLGYSFATWSSARLAAHLARATGIHFSDDQIRRLLHQENFSVTLVFQDELEIHRHPTLTRMWAPVGCQPEIPAPGKNEKQVVYGGVDFATGQTICTIAATKCGTEFIAFLAVLTAAYAGRKVRLVGDMGRFHHPQAVKAWLAAHRDQIEVFWLPPCCPSLNLIERLWGHLKRTVLANVLYQSTEELVNAFRTGVERLNGHRDQMGFMFNHDDVRLKKAG